mgnify:CR=1 FL=1
MQTQPRSDSTRIHFIVQATPDDREFCESLADKVNSTLRGQVVTPEGLFTDVDFYRRNPRERLNLGAGYLGHRVVQVNTIQDSDRSESERGLRQRAFVEAAQAVKEYLGR